MKAHTAILGALVALVYAALGAVSLGTTAALVVAALVFVGMLTTSTGWLVIGATAAVGAAFGALVFLFHAFLFT